MHRDTAQEAAGGNCSRDFELSLGVEGHAHVTS